MSWTARKPKIGVLITLGRFDRPHADRSGHGRYYETLYGKYPKIQILTIEDLFSASSRTWAAVDQGSFKKPRKKGRAANRTICRF